jgi:short-subunit dehydrogenase
MAADFAGQNILITGASSGLGRALALRLASAGASLALVGRRADALEAAASECRAKGAAAVSVHVADLAVSAGIEPLLGNIIAQWGGAPDVLIHCAGVGLVGGIEQVPIAEIERCLAVHFTAAAALAHAVLPDMRRRGAGRLVFVTSATAWYGVPGEAAYSAAKAALERLAEALAIEIRGAGVTVTIVSPGPVETPLMRSPRVFGGRSLIARPDKAMDPAVAAAAIVERLAAQSSGRIELALRPRIVRHMAYWIPRVLALLLARQFHKERS